VGNEITLVWLYVIVRDKLILNEIETCVLFEIKNINLDLNEVCCYVSLSLKHGQ
jgi:hypothetical protein